MGHFLLPLRIGEVVLFIVAPGMLCYRYALFELVDLSMDLIFQCPAYKTNGIQVLDFHLGAQRARSGRSHRDVHVATQAPFFHIAIAYS